MTNPWDERFAKQEYIYGTEPIPFFKNFIDEQPPGNILLLAEGEGKHAVYSATKGWNVDAVDYSESGRKKALKLASKKKVEFNYLVSDLSEYKPESGKYDAVGLFYFHVGEELRISTHKKAIESLKKGGHIILQCFSEEQLKFNSGGPKKIDYLYTLEQIFIDFQDLDLVKFEKLEMEINEGNHHKGMASIIQFIGRKA